MHIPDTVLANICMHFDIHQNLYFRRISQRWRMVLTKVFLTNHLSVDQSISQQYFHWTSLEALNYYRKIYPKNIKEWFAVQKETQRGRGIFVFGRGETLVPEHGLDSLVDSVKECVEGMEYPPKFWLWTNVQLPADDVLEFHIPSRLASDDRKSPPIPPECRVMLKDCRIDGVNWFSLLPHDVINTLFSIHVTEMEHINIGHMCKGRRAGEEEPGLYIYGEGEAQTLSAELLRLGRKYARPMTAHERHILHSTYQYFYLKQYHVGPTFAGALDSLMLTHEPELAKELLPNALSGLSRDFMKVRKLKPLTERLLEAIARQCNYV